jgi:hypothetical protein
MRTEDDGDELEMTVLGVYPARGAAEVALSVLLDNGIPAILTAEGGHSLRVPRKLAEEARDLLVRGAPSGDENRDAPTPLFWSTGLALVAGFFALLVAVWVLDRVVGVFH